MTAQPHCKRPRRTHRDADEPKSPSCSQSHSKQIPLSSLCLKSVLLYDWWLARAKNGNGGLAVAGFAREKLGARVFCSAAIVKRHDATTLETIDGITITITGFINRSRTHQNGFSFQVCNHFLLGFPYCWEEHATNCYGEEFAKEDVPTRNCGRAKVNTSPGTVAKTAMPIPLDELPPGKVHDLLRDPLPDSKDCPLDDIPEQGCSTTSKHTVSAHSQFENESTKNCSKLTNYKMNGSRKNYKAKGNHNQGNASGIFYAAETAREEFNNKTKGVVTRSISRLRRLEKGMM